MSNDQIFRPSLQNKISHRNINNTRQLKVCHTADQSDVRKADTPPNCPKVDFMYSVSERSFIVSISAFLVYRLC